MLECGARLEQCGRRGDHPGVFRIGMFADPPVGMSAGIPVGMCAAIPAITTAITGIRGTIAAPLRQASLAEC
ncbi:hypothetical protein ASE63_25270 [Bosea sp. Root381]|nr:hypothetical protein ASE63_25270 [Bosea sp. Root381]